MSDVLSSVTAHTLGADILTYHSSASHLRCAAIFFLHEGDDVGVDLSKDKWAVILEREIALLYGPDGNGAATVNS